MLRLLPRVIMMLGFFMLQSVVYGQDAEGSGGPEAEQAEQQVQDRRARREGIGQLSEQEREARRAQRRQQLEALSDEQREAVRERRRTGGATGAGQRRRPQSRAPRA